MDVDNKTPLLSHSQLYFRPSYLQTFIQFFDDLQGDLLRLAVSRRRLNYAGNEADQAADSCSHRLPGKKLKAEQTESVCLLQELRVKHMIPQSSC